MQNKVVVQAVSLVLAGFIAGAAVAAEGKADTRSAGPAAASGGSHQVAFFDPVTKRLRAPTPEEAAKFAKEMAARRAVQGKLDLAGNVSNRPRTQEESLRNARTLNVNGYQVLAVETPESEINNLYGTVDAKGQLRASHSDKAAVNAEVTK